MARELPDDVREQRGDGVAAGEQDVEEFGADGCAVGCGFEKGRYEVVSLLLIVLGRCNVCVDDVVDEVWRSSVVEWRRRWGGEPNLA